MKNENAYSLRWVGFVVHGTSYMRLGHSGLTYIVYGNWLGDVDDVDPTTEIQVGNIVIHKK